MVVRVVFLQRENSSQSRTNMSFKVRFWQKVAVFKPKYNNSTNTQMIPTYDVETWVVIFWCVQFNFHNMEWLMEWNLNDLENFSKNDMACPKRLLNLKCIQWHHLKVYGIWFVSPYVIDRNSRYVVFIDNWIVIFA